MAEAGIHIRSLRRDRVVFAVFDGKARVSAWYGNRDEVERMAELRRRRKRRSRRPCMTCGTSFQSDGPHNRMCPLCRRRGNLGAHSIARGVQL